MRSDFPIQMLQRGKKYPWLLLFICIVAGGLIGFASGYFLRPIYEARATITANADIKENRPIITELMIDRQILHIGELFYQPQIVQNLLEQQSQQNNRLTLEDLYAMSEIERLGHNTLLKIRSTDPQLAASVANNWAKIIYEELESAKPHAIRAAEARQRIAMLNYCFPTAEKAFASDGPSPETVQFCKGLTFEEADLYLKNSNQILLEEDALTMGLSDWLNLSAFTPAPVPTEPIAYGRGRLAFSGALAGLLLGLIGIAFFYQKQSS